MAPQVNIVPSTPQHSMLSNPPTTQTGSNLVSQKESTIGLYCIAIIIKSTVSSYTVADAMAPQVNIVPSTPQHSMLSNPPTTQTGSNLVLQKESAIGLYSNGYVTFM